MRNKEAKFNLFSKTILGLIIILILGLTPLLWFQNDNLISGADVGFHLNPVNLLYRKCFTWDSIMDTGGSNCLSIVPVFDYIPQAFLKIMGLDLQNIEKIWFVFLFMFAGLAMFFFASQLKDEIDSKYELFPFLAAFFYMFNIFNIVTWEGVDRAILESMIAVPFILGLYYRGLKKHNFLFYAILVALVSIFHVSAIGNPPSFTVGLIIIVAFLCGSLVIPLVRKDRSEFFKRLKFILLIFTLCILFNLWIILPYSNQIWYQLSNSPPKPLDWLGGMSQFSNFWRVFRLMSTWQWYASFGEDAYAPYSKIYLNNFLFIALSVFFPLLAYSAIFFKKHRLIFFFTGLSLLGTFLAMGTSPPFGFFYKFLVRHFPGFWIFRSPYKFCFIISFGYAVLASISVIGIYYWLKEKIGHKVIATIVVFSIIALNLIFCYPILSGSIFPTRDQLKVLPIKHFKIPHYVFEAANFLNSQNGFFRVMMLPLKSWSNYKWGYATQSLLLRYFSKRPLLYKLSVSRVQFADFPVAGLMDLFERAFYQAKTNHAFKIPAIISAGYILQRNDLIKWGGEKDCPLFIKQKLSLQKDIKYLRSFGEFDIYKIDHYIPQVYCLDKLSLVTGGLESLLLLADTEFIDKPNFVFQEKNNRKFVSEHPDLFETCIIYKGEEIQEPAALNLENKKTVYVFPCKILEFIPVDEGKIKSQLVENFYETQVFVDKTLPSKQLGRSIPADKVIPSKEPGRSIPAEKASWKWMNGGMSKIHLYNPEHEKQKTNLEISFYCISPKSVIISLNDKQIHAIALQVNQDNAILLKELELEPGQNTLSLYTPNAPDAMGDFLKNNDKRNIFIAVKEDIKIGDISNKGEIIEEFQIFKGGDYKIQIFPDALTKHHGTLNTKGVFLTVDERRVLLANRGDYLEGELKLSDGQHHILFEYQGKEILNGLVIKEASACISQITKVDFKKYNSTKYAVDINSEQPFVLILNECFDGRWRARIPKGSNIGIHFKINDFANAWYIDKTGEYKIELYYWPQSLYRWGIILSVFSISVVFCYAGIRALRIRKQ